MLVPSVQATPNDATINYLQDTFVPVLHRSVTSSLERAGKGWFSLAVSDRKTYESSKLCKLLTAVRFMMESTVRQLVLDSVRAFAAFARTACGAAVAVKSAAEVQVTRAGHDCRATPLLALALVIDDKSGEIEFSDDIAAYPERMATLLLRGAAAAEGLQQLEPLLLTQLHWGTKPPLRAVDVREAAVQDAASTVRAAWATAAEPAQRYLSLWRAHAPLLARDNDAYVAALAAQGAELSVEEVEGELHAAEAKLTALRAELPKQVRIWARV